MKTLIVKSLLSSSTSRRPYQREEKFPSIKRGAGVCLFPSLAKRGKGKFFNNVFPYLVLFVVILLPLIAFAGVKGTKHDLSVSGPGTVKAVSETGVCVFCHTPHNAAPAYPLWNHELSSVTNYISYWSETLKSYGQGAAPPIDGFSKLCLGCHDGTVAVGATIGPLDTIKMVTIPGVIESGRLKPGSAGYLGTDLSGGHPISIVYNNSLVDLRKNDPDSWNLIQLKPPPRKFGDKNGAGDTDVMIYPTQGDYGVQCTSCHDPHGGKGGPSTPPFWRKTIYDDVCLVCHDISLPNTTPGVGP